MIIECSQGSVLGPLLFLILMIDINRNTQNANLGSFVTQPNICKLVLDQMYIWAEDINLLFNRDKFELLNFGKSPRTFHYETPQGKQIETKESVRDLGIIFEPNGKFDKHITSVVAKVIVWWDELYRHLELAQKKSCSHY